jgi:hypothetical protein
MRFVLLWISGSAWIALLFISVIGSVPWLCVLQPFWPSRLAFLFDHSLKTIEHSIFPSPNMRMPATTTGSTDLQQ